MKEIVLTQGYVAVVDDEDFEAVNKFNWHAEIRRQQVYAARKVPTPNGNGTTQYLHQFLLPSEISVDHADRNGLNNTRINLRPATWTEQQGNRPKRVSGTSRYKGVYLDRDRGRWTGRLATLGVPIFQKRFDYEHEAALAYDRAAVEKWGDRAVVNFPRRGREGRTTILFVGWSGAGKDAASEYLAAITGLRYGLSFSRAGLPFMAEVMGLPEEQAYAERHAHREKWKAHLDYLREGDETLLAEIALVKGEVLAGLRDRVELDAARRKDLFSHVVWIERPGVPRDSTVTFEASECDCVILNDGTLDEFHLSIWKWANEHCLLNVHLGGPCV